MRWDLLDRRCVLHILRFRRYAMLAPSASSKVQKWWRKKRTFVVKRLGFFYYYYAERPIPLLEEAGMLWSPRVGAHACTANRAEKVRSKLKKRGYGIRFVVDMQGGAFLGLHSQRSLSPIRFTEEGGIDRGPPYAAAT